MNTQLLVAIITGIFGVVIAPIITQIVIPVIKRRLGFNGKDRALKSRTKRRFSQTLSTILQAGVGGVGGLLLGYFLISPFIVSSCPPFASTKINITSPIPDSDVARLIMVQGTSCHIPNGKELWVLAVPEDVTAFYPQTGPVVTSSDGNWSASAYIGGDNTVDIGKGFVLIAALANEQGSSAIHRYFAQSHSDFKGLEPLPEGIQIMTQVRVVRR